VKRLTPAFLTMVMFGIVGLLVVGYVAKTMLARDTGPQAPTTRNVPMAISDIAAGTLLTENHIGQGPFPVDKLDRDMLLVNRVIVGRVTKEAIKAAQPIKANQLYQPGELPALDVAEGMRAVTIEVGNGAAMIDGLAKPGSYVDVLFTYQGAVDDRMQGGLTMRLFEGVKILAINRNQQQSRVDRSANHVTLQLTEPQANVIVLAKDRGTLTLTYNPAGQGNGGLAVTNEERVTLYEILGMRPAEAPSEPFLTEVFKGQGRTLNYFNKKGLRLDNYRSSLQYQQDPGNNRNNMALPPSNNGGNNGDAPSDQDNVPQPTDTPTSRSAPTASRAYPEPR
jgi:pilus assembly protein CpaB